MSRATQPVRTLLRASAPLAVTLLATTTAVTPSMGPAVAQAGTAVAVSLTFTEPVQATLERSGCPVAPEGFCGHGQVRPFGQASEQIDFGACGPGCDVRTVTLPQGTLVLHEVFGNPGCPGSCRPNRAEQSTGDLTDVVASGTGLFAGAMGTLTGTVHAAGPESQVQLSGSIVLI